MGFWFPLVAVLAASALETAPYSPADLEAVARKVEALTRMSTRQPGKAPPPVAVNERELNGYLNVTLGARMPKGVTDVAFRFEQDRLVARALVDLEQVQGQLPRSPSLGGLISFLSGKVPLEARGRLKAAEDGFATLEIEQVSLSSIPVPVSLVGQLVASATKTTDNPEGFDLQSPFRLPYQLRRIRLEPGRAVLEF